MECFSFCFLIQHVGFVEFICLEFPQLYPLSIYFHRCGKSIGWSHNILKPLCWRVDNLLALELIKNEIDYP